jgi:hypothetical protein
MDHAPAFPLRVESLVSALLRQPRYSEPMSAIGELIQNGIDACRVRRELLMAGAAHDDYRPQVVVTFDEDGGTVSVKDNGVGMTEDVLRNHLMRIGSSYYDSPEFAAMNLGYRPKNRFGVGFLSCFKLADVVRVQTRSESEPSGHLLTIRRDSLSTTWKAGTPNGSIGTEVGLEVDPDQVVLKARGLRRYLEKNFVSNDIDIRLKVRHTEEFRIGADSPIDPNPDSSALIEGIRQMRRSGNIQPFLQVAQQSIRTLSNRDLIRFNETHLKILLLNSLRLGGFYLVQSEVETEAGYIDILLTKKIQHAAFIHYEWLIELKYLKARDRAKLEQIRAEGLEQLNRYAQSEVIRSARADQQLRKVLLTFVGKDEVVCDFLP